MQVHSTRVCIVWRAKSGATYSEGSLRMTFVAFDTSRGGTRDELIGADLWADSGPEGLPFRASVSPA